MSPASAPDYSQLSSAEKFHALPADEVKRLVESLTEDEADAILHDWNFFARPNQLEPAGVEWTNWLVMAGRGFGKTRVGAEQVRKWVKDYPIVNLVGQKAADLRDVMVRGSGAGSAILEICRRDERPTYEPSKRRLTWPNGAVSLLFSAEDPEGLRGQNHMKIWCDELAAWQYPAETWEQIEFGLRLGTHPQMVVTTTPKPIKLIKALVRDPHTVVSYGTTYDNRANLAQQFYNSIIRKYEGTRLGRQELNAELLEDNPNALFQRSNIELYRFTDPRKVPQLVRVVVAIDPAVSANEDSAETGIVIVGRDLRETPHYYVLADLTMQGVSPDTWAAEAVTGYYKHKADRVVAEVNNGGDLVESVIRHKDSAIPYKPVHATRGKLVRAEPISALYEQGRVHHVGAFSYLEDQMCDYVPGVEKSPDRMDALVWGLTELSGIEEQEMIVTHEEDIHISRELDDFDLESGSW